MKSITLALTLASGLLFFTNCERSSEPVAQVAKPAEPSDFPMFTQKYHEDDHEMTGSGTFSMGTNPKSLASLEHRYRSTREVANPKYKSSYGIRKSATESLNIRFSKANADGGQDLVAVWTTPIEAGGKTLSVSKISEPLKDDDQALELLKSYTAQNDEFKTAVEWKSPKDR